MSIRFALVATSVLLTANSVRAEVCPDNIPEDGVERRALAKKWFSKGEVAAGQNDDIAALKAYQCSLRTVPHGFTAYNIAQVAERIGDLELAIASYNQYLLLVPEAKDAQEVNDKLESLKERLAMVRQKESAMMVTPVGGTSGGIAPSRAGDGVGTQDSQGYGSMTTPANRKTTDDGDSKPDESVVADGSSGSKYHTAAWIVYGGGGVLIVAGVLTNVLSRGKMETCRSKYTSGEVSAAESACSDAKPLAYMSYGLFGLGAVAAAVGTVLVLRPTESSDVALSFLPEGGLSLGWRGKY
jgi:tetratricopeptide (TPR) repeat protein